jgi:glycosyltransferase involved in cell wall biosynthesis
VPIAINVFMRAPIEMLCGSYDITVVANGSADQLVETLRQRVRFVPIRIERNVSFIRDFTALVALYGFFRLEKFDVVHSMTPKAGVLAMTAGRLAGVPHRVHTFTGQVWATRRGIGRRFLKILDRTLVSNASLVLADSGSQRDFLIREGIASPQEIDVLADGSVGGVDTKRFAFSEDARREIRLEHGIPRDAVVFLFLGRLTRDKGLLDLARAFASVAKADARNHLLIVGWDEQDVGDALAELASRFPENVHRAGFATHPERYYSAADVICLPSYREGFGTVLIEAASVGLPAIASRIYGITDAVEDGVTGILHEPAADVEIAAAMRLLSSDVEVRSRMGSAARERARAKFSEARVTRAVADFYNRMLTASESASR